MMNHRIFAMNEAAADAGVGWDEAIYRGLIETVEEFDTYEDAVWAFEEEGYDPDFYGVE